MARKIEPGDLEAIDRLIRDEVAQALGRFRAGDFEGRVRRRLAAEAGPTCRRPMPWMQTAVWVSAALWLAVAVTSIVLVITNRPSVRAPIDAGPIAAVLGELPPFAGSAPEPAAGPAGETAIPGAGRAIASVLEATGAGKDRRAGPGTIGGGAPKAAPLTMKKRMEILFKDKVIERVLLSCASRSKEV